MRMLKLVIAAAIAASAGQALAQGFPNKPVHMVITFPPGSATDIVGRIFTQRLSEIWGQPVVVENRGGAGGSIGTAIVQKSPADGYTLLINSSAHAVNPSIYANLPYDTLKDFVDIAPLAGQPNVLVTASGSSIKTLKEMLADAKARPGKVNFASAGVGSGTHLNLEKFKLATGIDVTHIPYKGTQEVLSDLLGGRVDYYFAPISPAIPLIKDGKLRALGVSSAKRSASLPDAPTLSEGGVPGFEFTLWFGVWGPTGIPAELVNKINRDLARIVTEADTKEKLAKLGNDTMSMTPSEFSAFVRREIADYARIIKAAGIKPQ
jgi:tripartite-type tricarboxylate transporter receptor subunit TctC